MFSVKSHQESRGSAGRRDILRPAAAKSKRSTTRTARRTRSTTACGATPRAESLAKLKPFFDRKYGNVTAGNSSQITDGAAWLLLASEEALSQHGLQPIGRIVDSEWAGLDPAQMGLGPVHAATPILKRHDLGLNDLDYWEINEAFAAQVLGCLAAWKDEKYCREELGLDGAMGALDENKLNVDGGAIALGHPVGASGTRIVLHLLKTLKRNRQEARHSLDLHRRRPGRRDAGRSCLRGEGAWSASIRRCWRSTGAGRRTAKASSG